MTIASPLIAGPRVATVSPSTLPTEGGQLEIRGSNLAGAQVSADLTGSRSGAEPEITIEILENSREDCLLVRVGPGVGTRTKLLLESSYGQTTLDFAFEGEQRLLDTVGNGCPSMENSFDTIICSHEGKLKRAKLQG